MNTLRNSVQLIGRLGKDPDVKTFEKGKQRASFTIATTDTYKNQRGEKVEDTQWHQIVMWGKLAEIASKYLKKGRKLPSRENSCTGPTKPMPGRNATLPKSMLTIWLCLADAANSFRAVP